MNPDGASPRQPQNTPDWLHSQISRWIFYVGDVATLLKRARPLVFTAPVRMRGERSVVVGSCLWFSSKKCEIMSKINETCTKYQRFEYFWAVRTCVARKYGFRTILGVFSAYVHFSVSMMAAWQPLTPSTNNTNLHENYGFWSNSCSLSVFWWNSSAKLAIMATDTNQRCPK